MAFGRGWVNLALTRMFNAQLGGDFGFFSRFLFFKSILVYYWLFNIIFYNDSVLVGILPNNNKKWWGLGHWQHAEFVILKIVVQVEHDDSDRNPYPGTPLNSAVLACLIQVVLVPGYCDDEGDGNAGVTRDFVPRE